MIPHQAPSYSLIWKMMMMMESELAKGNSGMGLETLRDYLTMRRRRWERKIALFFKKG